MKDACFIFCSMLLLMTFCGCGEVPSINDASPPPSAIMATTPNGEYSGYEIRDLGNDECEIVSCSLKTASIIVPETIGTKTVRSLGPKSFAGLPVESVTFPDTLEDIGAYAFSECTRLEQVNFGSGLLRVSEMVFDICPSLETVSFPDGMTTMEAPVFGACENLHEVYIPASVTDIPFGIAYIDLCPNILIVTPEGSAAEISAREFVLPVVNSEVPL